MSRDARSGPFDAHALYRESYARASAALAPPVVHRPAAPAAFPEHLTSQDIETDIVIALLDDEDARLCLQRYAARGKGKSWRLLAAEAARTLATRGKEADAVRILGWLLPEATRAKDAIQIKAVLDAIAEAAHAENRRDLAALMCARWQGAAAWMLKMIENDDVRLVRLAQSTNEGAELLRKVVAEQSGSCDHVLWRERLASTDVDIVRATKAAVLSYAVSKNSLVQNLDVDDIWSDQHLELVGVQGLLDVRFLKWITVAGDLVFASNPAETLDLSGLTLGGTVSVNKNDALTTLNLSGLTAGGGVAVHQNVALTTLVLSGLTAGKGVMVVENGALRTLNGSGATVGEKYTVYFNKELMTLDLRGVTFNDDVKVYVNARLTTLDLRGATFKGNVTIAENDALPTLDLGGMTFDLV